MWYWHKNRYTDQWNRIESPGINPYTCGQLIFDKGGKKYKGEKVFSANAAGKVVQLHVNQCTKINSKWLKDLSIRHDTIKILEETICKTFSDRNQGNVFFGQCSKATAIKTNKNKQMGPNQSYKLWHSKRNHKKDNLQDGRKYLQTMQQTKT